MTGSEDIAAAIRDGLHEIAEAIKAAYEPSQPIAVTIQNPEPAAPRDELGPLFCWCGARTAKRMVSRRMGRYCPKGHNPDNPPTPRPMTVGQLGAEHIGKRVRVDHPHPFDGKLESIQHRRMVTFLDPNEPNHGYFHDTPCTVVDE